MSSSPIRATVLMAVWAMIMMTPADSPCPVTSPMPNLTEPLDWKQS